MLITFTKKGIYCPQADVYIDPWRVVKRALITHGHADHAKRGHKHYLCTHAAKPVIKYRLGDINIDSVAYGEKVQINGVNFSFHPAGHVIGSAQIKVEYKGEIWVASGDYKLQNDGVAAAYEPIKCHTFITESTFGLPIYKWRRQESVFNDVNQWWQKNKALGKASLITSYSLGKAQRILQNVDHSIGKIYAHGAIENTNEIIRKQGIPLHKTIKVEAHHQAKDFEGALIIAPPSVTNSPWMRKIGDCSIAAASGWMAVRAGRKWRPADEIFVLSDHADWDELNEAVDISEAEKIYVTHGYTDVFARWLRERGKDAQTVETAYQGEPFEGEPTNESS